MLPLLFLTGLAIAPMLIMQQACSIIWRRPHRLNEAQAFLSAANTTGAALGTALAGLLIDARGLGWSFAGAAAGAVVAAVAALLSRPSWRRASLAISESDSEQERQDAASERSGCTPARGAHPGVSRYRLAGCRHGR